MSEELRPCPFCGEQVFTPFVASLDDGYAHCIFCGAKMQRSRWNTRPIEDDLRKRIAELERDRDMLFRSAMNNQPRKNTQTQTFVYGKESEE